jgi:hypothetical protein
MSARSEPVKLPSKTEYRLKFALLFLLVFYGAAIGAATAAEAPQPKPGWWELRSTVNGKTGAARMCTTASQAAESRRKNDDYNKQNCSKNETRHEGDRWTTDRVCKVGDSTMIGTSVVAFDGEDAYHTESTATYDPPFNGQSRKSVTVDAKWLDTCAEGRMPEVVK